MRIGKRIVWASVLLVSVALWGASPQAGTWKLNAAKSKGTTDHPVPKDITVTITEQGDGITLEAKGEDASGKPVNVHWTAKPDGKDYPANGTPDGSTTVSVKQPNANTLDITNKKDGQVTTTVHSVVSQDGKTRTSTWSGKDSKGNPETWTNAFDKQ